VFPLHHRRGGLSPERRRVLWAWLRPAVGVAILALLLWQLGPGPFLEAIQRIDAWSLTAAAAIAVPTTAACAWRWRLVSRGMGSDLPLRGAIGAYYRSQFLNLVLPGGVLGDVHRAVRRGRDVGDVGHGVRAVVWERTAGQVVQIVLTVVVLLALPSPVRSSMPAVVVAVAAVTLAVVLLGRTLFRRGSPGRIVRALASDIRKGLLARRAWPGIVLASTVVVAGHTATFLIAARTAGSTAPSLQLLPLALLVLLAMALPTNVAGWGPREGAAAWVFAMAGLGAAQGVATAVVYGVMALVATLPGAALLLVTWLRPVSTIVVQAADGPVEPEPRRRPRRAASLEGVTRG
jgi:glycosyltransferase 2 family protein